jgi:cystathionine beta-lyase
MTLDDLLVKGTDVGVAWQDGRLFNDPWSIRMNLALPLAKVQEAFSRLDRYVFCG